MLLTPPDRTACLSRHCTALAIDILGANAYIAGYFTQYVEVSGSNPTTISTKGSNDAWIAKMDVAGANGMSLKWLIGFGSTSSKFHIPHSGFGDSLQLF